MISASLWLISATACPPLDDPAQATKRNSDSAGEHRGRLVEDEHLRVAAQALDDLDALAHAGRQPTTRASGSIGRPYRSLISRHSAQVAAGSSRPDVAERDVLPDGQRLDQAEVLVHHAEPSAAASCGS